MELLKKNMKYKDVLGVKTAFFEHINDSTISTCIFLHGGAPGASTELNWFKNLDEAINNGLNVIAFDQVGFGYSSSPPNGDHSVEFRYAHAVEFINTFQLKEVHLIGNSIGGLLASLMSLRGDLKSSIKSLLLLAPYPFFPIPENIEDKMKMHRSRLGAITQSFDSIKTLCQNTFYDKGLVDDSIVKLRLSFLQEYNWENHLQRVNQGRSFIAPKKKTIEHKTRIVWGIQDNSLPIDICMHAIKENLFSNADYLILNHCAHWPQTEQYKKVNEVIANINY